LEVIELEKLVSIVCFTPSLATMMERREYPRKHSGSMCSYAHSYLPTFSTEHPFTFAKFCSPHLPPIPQQPQQYQNTISPTTKLLPTKPMPNLNKKPTQPLHNVDMKTFPTYVISPIPLHEIQLRSRKVLDRQRPSVVIW
jgi:hypothetical protein